MRRNGRRALALLLTLVMALCLTVPALAAEEVFEAETPAGLAEDAPAAPIGPEVPDMPEAASAEPVDAPAAAELTKVVYEVGNTDELREALTNTEEETDRTVRLKNNIELTKPIVILEQHSPLLLDLNGWTITKAGIADGTAAITLQNVGQITMQGGIITGQGTLLQTDNYYSSLHLEGITVKSTGADGGCAAVCANGGSVRVKDGAVIEAEGTAIYAFGKAITSVRIAGGSVVSHSGCAIIACGEGEYISTVNVSSGEVESETGAGVYLLPGGRLLMTSKGTVTGKAGVVVRGGMASILSGNVIANGTDSVQVGDGAAVPPAAVVVDDTGSATLSGTAFKAEPGQPVVVYTKNGQPANKQNGVDGSLLVGRGFFSSAVDEALLSTNVKYMLVAEDEGNEVPYTYTNSPREMKSFQEQLRCAAILAVGFIGTTETGGNDILNGCAREVLGEEKSITDCIPNTLYAVFKAAFGYAGPYTVRFRAGEEKKTYTETSPADVSAGGVFYASFDHQADVFKDSPEGWYVAELYKGEGTETLVSSAYFMICKVTYAPGSGAQGEAVTVYTDEAGLEAALAAGRPDGITLSGGSNTWDEPVAERTGRFSWTVTFPAHYEYHGGLIIPDTTPSPSPSASPEPSESPSPTPTPGPGVTPAPVPVDPPKTNGGSGWSYDYDTGDYYYFVDGEPKASYWANEADASQWGYWYYVGADGKLATGLQYIENNNGTGWYFLQPDNADGCIGRMLTGWQWLGTEAGMGWFNTAHGGVNGQCTWTENWGDYDPATGLWEDGLSHK